MATIDLVLKAAAEDSHGMAACVHTHVWEEERGEHVHTCARLCVHVGKRNTLHVHTFMHVHLCDYTHVCVREHVCLQVYAHVCICIGYGG